MAYEQNNFDEQVREQFGLSDTETAAVLDFLEANGNADGTVITQDFETPGGPEPITIPEEVEAAAIKAGGTYTTTGTNVLINIETDEAVVINGVTVPGGSIAVIGGGGDDTIKILSGPGAAVNGVGTLNAPPDAPGNGLVAAGAGDDTVEGGIGDDSISGGAGDDMLMAGAGGDTLDGGGGSDSIDGGEGFDIVMLSDMSRDDVTVSTEGGLFTIAAKDGGDTDSIENVEYLTFTDGAVLLGLGDAGEGAVARLYETFLDRAADAGGLEFWLQVAEDGASLADIAARFIGSREFLDSIDGALSNEDFVELLYERGLERAADEAGLAFWSGLLEDTGSGAALTRAEVAAFFAGSAEAEDAFDYINILSDTDLI